MPRCLGKLLAGVGVVAGVALVLQGQVEVVWAGQLAPANKQKSYSLMI